MDNIWNEFKGLSDPELQPAYPHVEHESKYGWVLVFDKVEDIQIACMVWNDHEDLDYSWITETEQKLENVTHWMPFPKSPE